MKNKSFYYVLPVFFYDLIDDGISLELGKYIKNSYLYSRNGNFVMVLNTIDSNTNENIPGNLIESLSNSKKVHNVTIVGSDLMVEFKPDLNNDLIEVFKNGRYSDIDKKYMSSILDFMYNYEEIDNYIKIGYVIYKNDKLKEAISRSLEIPVSELENLELESKINIEEETIVF